MLTYALEDGGKETLMEQLYRSIRRDIMNGVLKAGEKLPSKRNFAANLGVSTITVENAYAQLAAEGYIYTLPRKGCFVSEIGLGRQPEHTSRPAGPESKAAPAPAPEYFADFAGNQTRSEFFPFSIWTRLSREILSDSRIDLMTNPPSEGILALREAIAGHLRDYHGLQVDPEQIIVGAGTEYLYGLLIQLLGPDHRYAFEDPGYRKVAKIFRSWGINCCPVEMDASGIRVSQLREKQADIIHTSPSHQFPTGITMPIARRMALLAWADEQPGRYIIEDDYDSELRLSGQPIPVLQTIDRHEKVIYINTFTRTLASTVRISYMVLPPHLAGLYRERLSFYSCTVSTFEQYTLAAFIQRGYFGKHIKKKKKNYRELRDRLLAALNESPLKGRMTISGEDAGLHFLMKVDTRLSDDEICMRAQKKGIRMNALSHYADAAAKSSSHTFLICYASLPDDRLREAVDRLAEILI